MVIPSGKARLAGVMGWPVGHSRSPRLHGFWLEQYGIDGAYVPLAVPPARLGEALKALSALGFAGVNLTLPHKEAALAHVDGLSEAARRIGAVNTVTVQSDGTLLADNTDGFGFIEHLRASAPGWHGGAGPIAVLGAGGAARAVVVALLDAGVSELRLINRTPERGQALAEAFGSVLRPLLWKGGAEALDGVSLLVNTTSLGMTGQPTLELDLAQLPRSAVVYDLVYAPLDTRLLSAARARGNPVVDGLGMLLHQARPGFRAWFGVEPEVTPALRAFVMRDLKG
jgi:shikimate dehydrogenase